MYNELNDFLLPETTVDSWYDDGFIIAQYILLDFSDQDWEELAKNVLTKSLDWQKKLAYCLDNKCSANELKILLLLITTKDQELFVMVIDSLRSFTDYGSKQLILKDNSIMERINNLLPDSSIPVQMILKDFLKKINE